MTSSVCFRPLPAGGAGGGTEGGEGAEGRNECPEQGDPVDGRQEGRADRSEPGPGARD